jgi:hypothetical protein
VPALLSGVTQSSFIRCDLDHTKRLQIPGKLQRSNPYVTERLASVRNRPLKAPQGDAYRNRREIPQSVVDGSREKWLPRI